jgi:ATP-binding cassette, subfamily B, multidrug efflux pump
MREHLASYALGTLLVAATLWMTFAIPRYVAQAIDLMGASAAADGDALFNRLLLIVAFAVAIVGVRTGSRLAFFVPGRRAEFDLKNRMLVKLSGLQRDFYLANPSGAVISRMNNDINGVRMLLGAGLMRALSSIGTLSLAPVYMYQISPDLTLYCTVPLVAGFLLVQSGMRKMRKYQLQQMQDLRTLSEFTVESLNGVDVLKSYGGYEWAQGSFWNLSEKVRITATLMSTIRAYFMPLLLHLTNGLKMLLLIVGGTLVINEQLSPGDFTAYLLYLSLLVMPLVGMTFMLFMLQRGYVSLGALMEVLFADCGIAEPHEPLPAKVVVAGAAESTHVSIKNLSFAYPDQPESRVLRDLNFTIEQGQVVGLFGGVGAGKSTLVNILNGHLKIPPGHVYLNGEDIVSLGHQRLRAQVRTVSQEPFLFSDSIRNNIALAVDDGNGSRILDAAEAAALGPDLERMPSGLETVVGERGITLSGGQKQRVALARALVEPSPVLLLDDVLSAVDHDTERALIDAIYAQVHEQATLLVSHRLSVLERADLVLVLDDGYIFERGSHAQLIDRSGPYRDAWLLQRSGQPENPRA